MPKFLFGLLAGAAAMFTAMNSSPSEAYILSMGENAVTIIVERSARQYIAQPGGYYFKLPEGSVIAPNNLSISYEQTGGEGTLEWIWISIFSNGHAYDSLHDTISDFFFVDVNNITGFGPAFNPPDVIPGDAESERNYYEYVTWWQYYNNYWRIYADITLSIFVEPDPNAPQPVPVPASLPLLATALAGLRWLSRRRSA